MKIAADEHISLSIVAWLRQQGHEVRRTADAYPGDGDDQLLGRAWAAGEVVLTRDLDFGTLVVRDRRACVGVVIFRPGRRPVREHLEILQKHWGGAVVHAAGHLVVITPDRYRVRPLRMEP